MTGTFVKLNIQDHVATITIDRPPVNALSLPVFEELIQTFADLERDDNVRVAILTGAGEKAFCAGGDRVTSPNEAQTDRISRSQTAQLAILNARFPVIAAINGPCIGAGLMLAAMCDIIVASDRSYFSIPAIDLGKAVGGATIVSRILPQAKLRTMVYTGEKVPAAEFYRLGAIESVVPGSQLKDEARKFALILAAKDPACLRPAKRNLNEIEYMDLARGMNHEAEGIVKYNKA